MYSDILVKIDKKEKKHREKNKNSSIDHDLRYKVNTDKNKL